MPRILKKGKCKVCDQEYILKDRKYKRTCSPICASRLAIRFTCYGLMYATVPVSAVIEGLYGAYLDIREIKDVYEEANKEDE